MDRTNHTFNFTGAENEGVHVGINSGHINIHAAQTGKFQALCMLPVHNVNYRLPCTERLEITPSPSCMIPFNQDKAFVNRGTVLAEVHEKCGRPASRAALVGLGGVG